MKNLAKWLLVSTALTPLIFSANSLFPYVFPKAVFFRFVIFFATVAISILLISSADARRSLTLRICMFWQHSLGKAVTFMMASLAISTVFAYDRFTAFFGNIERAEGFIGIFFFYIFLVLAYSLFDRKDWLLFYWVNQFTGLILFFLALVASLQGEDRPGALINNPIFLAVYFLFLIYAALVTYRESRIRPNVTARAASVFFMVLSVIGIFITQSRGVMLGIIIGLFVVLGYLAAVRGNFMIGKYRLRVVSIMVGVVMVLFGGVFIATRHATVWQHIPGFSRLAVTSLGEGTTDSRVVMAKISLHAVTSRDEGVKKVFFGWGWDNFVYAWQKFYEPDLYRFDPSSFDRAHNKILDVLLMTGFVGLALYLAVWFYIFRSIIKIGKQHSVAEASFALLFATAFFVQNLTVFDVLVTFLAWFAFIGYILNSIDTSTSKNVNDKNYFMTGSVIALAIFLGIAFFSWTYAPYRQNVKYRISMDEVGAGRTPAVLLSDEPVFSPDNFAQRIMRDSFLRTAIDGYNVGALPEGSPLLKRSIALMEAYVEKHPPTYTNYMTIGSAYTAEAIFENNPALFEKGRDSYDRALELIPGRQDVLYSRAVNLLQSGMQREAVALLEGVVSNDPSLPQNHYQLAQAYLVLKNPEYDKALIEIEFALEHGVNMDASFTRRAYQNMLMHYYKTKDVERFKTALSRLITLDSKQAAVFGQILEYINQYNKIPPIGVTSE